MTIVSPGATHRGAPFVGRTRELGLLRQLVNEGLEGSPNLVWVAGETGSGRRRMIREVLRRGPDCEWIDLAPGGVEADLPRWVKTELLDLLDSYPEAPVPSWALHLLSRFDLRLLRRAPIPRLSREAVPADQLPELIGTAIGCALQALTARTTVVVDAGLWPRASSRRERTLRALRRAIQGPGTVLLSAIDADHAAIAGAPGVHTVHLPALTIREVRELAAAWTPGLAADRLGGWLHRVTGGHPLYVHEAIRWLEETGSVHVDDDAETVRLLDPPDRFPLPLGLETVMINRSRRLSLAAAYLAHLIGTRDGELDAEGLRAIYEGPEETFDDALAQLRKRAYLLHRSPRHPIALATPIWRTLVRAPSRRRFRRRRTPVETLTPVRTRRPPRSPLAGVLAGIAALTATLREDPEAIPVPEVAALMRRSRGRTGPAWSGARGRSMLLAALLRKRAGRPDGALRWIARGRRELAPDRHPNLRRSLGLLATRILERDDRPVEADRIRSELLEEALLTGQLRTAALLRAATAEGRRRLGRPDEALALAAAAEQTLLGMGLTQPAGLTRATRVYALMDARRLSDAARLLRDAGAPRTAGAGTVSLRKILESGPESPELVELAYSRPLLAGWGWGLEDAGLPTEARAALVHLASAARGKRTPPTILARLETDLERSGHRADLADLRELRVHAELASANPGPLADLVAAAADACDAIGFHRLRNLASELLRTAAGSTRPFDDRLRPLLLRATAPTRVETRDPARLYVMGRGRVELDDSVWPAALWPEWWLRLVAAAVAGSLLDRPAAEDDLRRALDAAGRDDVSLGDALDEANLLLWRGAAGPGGFVQRGGRWVWSWSGIWCDARAVIADLETADLRDAQGDAADAAAFRETALGRAGSFLPALDTEDTRAARGRLAERVLEALRLQLAREPELDGERYAAWMDGPARLADLSAVIAPRLRNRGWSRAAAALRPGRGSP